MMMTVVLLVVALTVNAQGVTKGTMTRLGTKMEYSFSGGVVTNKSLKGQGTTDMIVSIEGQVEAGKTLTATFKKIVDWSRVGNNVQVEVWAETTNGEHKELQNKSGKESATASVKVPDNAKKVKLELSYSGKMGRFHCFIDWNVVKNVSATSSKTISGILSGANNNNKGKITYSFSGGTIVKKEIKKGSASYECELPVGSPIEVTAKVEGTYHNILDMSLTLDGHILKSTDNKSSTTTFTYTLPSSYKVPDHYTGGLRLLASAFGESPGYLNILWLPTKKGKATSTQTKSFKWDDVAGDDRCSHCKGQFSNYFIANVISNVIIYCNSYPNESKRKAVDGLTPIYYNDRINTSGSTKLVLDHCDEKGVLTFMENTSAHLKTRLQNGKDRWDVYKGRIVGKGLKHADCEFEMSSCTAKPTGTTYVLEDDGKTSHVYLLEGSMEVTSKKGSKKQTLKPGQAATVTNQGQMSVNSFDVGAMAKKYNISGVSTTTTTTTTTTQDKNDIYDLKCAVVKYKFTQGKVTGQQERCFDNYGKLERRTFKASTTETMRFYRDNKTYDLDVKKKTMKVNTDARMNFHNTNDSRIKKTDKRKTTTILGKTCTLYQTNTTDYWVWKGIVLKKIEHLKDGTQTITEATSIQTPSSLPASTFEIPKGYKTTK